VLDRVLITPFRTMVVPPPMSAFYLQMAAPVTQVAFCSAAELSNDVAVLLSTGQLVIYTMTQCKGLRFFFILRSPTYCYFYPVDSHLLRDKQKQDKKTVYHETFNKSQVLGEDRSRIEAGLLLQFRVVSIGTYL